MAASYPEALRELVDRGLAEYFPAAETEARVVYDAMRYAVFTGGKRFRPVLTLLCATAVGRPATEVVPAAGAVEFVHTYSLIHDDLPALDNDSLRRGQPACHVKFGEDIAILAGDALLAEAFRLVAHYQTAEPALLVKVIDELAGAAGAAGMVAGQVADILATGRQVDRVWLEYIHNHKTAKLMVAAGRIGAILAGASEPALQAITDYAGYLGLAFQVVDDILDVVGEPALLGKNVGGDMAQHKSTFPALLGVAESRVEARRLANRAKTALAGAPLRADELIELADFVVQRES